MACAWSTVRNWSFLSVLLSSRGAAGSFFLSPQPPRSFIISRNPIILSNPIRFPRSSSSFFEVASSSAADDQAALSSSESESKSKTQTKGGDIKAASLVGIRVEKFPNAALDKSLIPDTIGRSGISKTVPAQIHFPDPEEGQASVQALNELLIPDTIGKSGIGKSVPIQLHFPKVEKEGSAEALLIPDTIGKGGTGYSASLIPDTIGNSGISKSIPVQIHFPDPETKVSAEALLIPDFLGEEGGTGFTASLTPDTIGNSGISKTVPVQIHFPEPEKGKVAATALNDFLAPDTIGNSGIGKSIPIQIHFPKAQGRVSAEPLDAFLIPDTIGYSGISKSIPAERKFRFPSQSFSRLLSGVPEPVANQKDTRQLKAGPGKLSSKRNLTTDIKTAASSSSATVGDSKSRTDGDDSKQLTTDDDTTKIMSTPSIASTWLGGGGKLKADAMSQCILPLSFDSHKGSSGRVGVLGGSAQYTGAPYYAAMACLKAGADLSYVFCAQEACLPIKSYSPELMVTPVYNAAGFDALAADDYNQKNTKAKQQVIDRMVQEVTSKLERLHVLVIGPGLGRCPLVCEATAQIIQHAKKKKLAMVLDADALWMLAQPEYRNLFEGYEDGAPVVLTPNVVEYKRLVDSLSPAQLECTTIVKKGRNDVIVQNGVEKLECQEMGGKKRSGGIGDVLAGTIGTVVSWNRILHKKGSSDNILALSCWTACCFVKHATLLAFNDKKRSMTAPDVLEYLGSAINEMTDEEEVVGPTTSNL